MRQLELFPAAPSPRKLPTNLTTRRHPVHRWFNFIAGFSPEFVTRCICESGLGTNGRLIDPFAGLSTALVQANFEGVSSVGFETHPFFYDISLAKLFPPTRRAQVDRIESIAQSIEPYAEDLTHVWTTQAVAFLLKLVPESDLRLLASALLAEGKVAQSDKPLYRLAISRVLELAATSQTDGIYKAPTTSKGSVSYRPALEKVCSEIREDIDPIVKGFRPHATLFSMSSEAMTVLDDETCSLCVTSPPYLNNFDYAEMTRMEFYFWRYAGSWREITERVRRRLIVNTTTAPTDLKRAQDRFSETLSRSIRALLEPLVEALRDQRRIRPGKKDYDLLVYPYFAQMQTVFRELRRVLKPDSPFHLLVADAALYGVHIETDKLLARLMEESGFEVLDIERMRTRGDRWVLEKRQGAKRPLGEFHVHARRI